MSIYNVAKKLAPKLIDKFKNDELITIESKQRVSDGMGGSEYTWVTKFTCDCAVLPSTAREVMAGMQLNQVTTHKAYINYSDAAPTADDRLVFKGRVFNINQVINNAEANAVYTLMLKEGVVT